MLLKKRDSDNTDHIAHNVATQVEFENCASFKDCRTNWIEYIDNYSIT